jgi:Cytochrome P460
MKSLKSIALLVLTGTAMAGTIASLALPSVIANETPSVPGIQLPPEYRDWRLISVAHEEGSLNDLRAILGNDPAISAYRAGTLPFPDGTIIARLAWTHTPSEENNKVFGREQSFVAGSATNIQLMVKDSKKYAETGGWGFAQFTNGKPAGEATIKACFACHVPAKARDYVFTRYAQ